MAAVHGSVLLQPIDEVLVVLQVLALQVTAALQGCLNVTVRWDGEDDEGCEQ